MSASALLSLTRLFSVMTAAFLSGCVRAPTVFKKVSAATHTGIEVF